MVVYLSDPACPWASHTNALFTSLILAKKLRIT